VLYVPDNHKFYGASIEGTVEELKRLCAGTSIHVLDNDEVTIDGVRFLGTTLWTDFMLFGEGEKRAAGSLLNACFVSDAERLIDGRRTRLWIHGHTHDSFDYWVNGTRVLCNPRGYARNGVNENPLFDPNFLVEID
jgi:hypothetical protein